MVKQMTFDFESWRRSNPSVAHIMAGVCDISGAWRGKRLPIEQAAKIFNGSMRLPKSIVGVDIWGEDPETSILVYEDGDPDGFCQPTGRGILEQNWSETPSGLIPVTITDQEGKPFLGDPRQVLVDVISRFKAKGLKPVCALELEFYLYDPTRMPPRPPKSPRDGSRLDEINVLALDEIEIFDSFFNDVYSACKLQGIELDAAISENGSGQFEINFMHSDDPLKAADDAVFFKRIVKGIARKHGFGATFMAKPYGDTAGSGLHMHMSIVDENGQNVFDDGSDEGSDVLRHAVGGILANLTELTLIFAPHRNSFRRLTPRAHAPTEVAWAYENRTTAVRIPNSSNQNRRIEHRVAGSDANPYLVAAAVLGSALWGMERKIEPPAPESNGEELPENWDAAFWAFEEGANVKSILNPTIHHMILDIKRQEIARFNGVVSHFEYQTYLGSV